MFDNNHLWILPGGPGFPARARPGGPIEFQNMFDKVHE